MEAVPGIEEFALSFVLMHPISPGDEPLVSLTTEEEWLNKGEVKLLNLVLPTRAE